MPVNNFLVFDTTNGNKMSQTDYAAATVRLNGVGSGTASSPLANKTWAQSSIIAAMIAQYIVDISGNDALDDGTITTLLANFKLSTKGRLINARLITTLGVSTYTETPGTKAILLWLLSGGASSAGAIATGVGAQSTGGAGSSGGFALSYLTTGFSGATLTIGAGGAAVTGANGANGGASSFAALISVPGGLGGQASGAGTNPIGFGGIPGAPPTGANLFNLSGQAGGFSFGVLSAGALLIPAEGGNTLFGSGGAGQIAGSPGNDGVGFGSGGGSTSNQASSAALLSGRGAQGCAFIMEFS